MIIETSMTKVLRHLNKSYLTFDEYTLSKLPHGHPEREYLLMFTSLFARSCVHTVHSIVINFKLIGPNVILPLCSVRSNSIGSMISSVPGSMSAAERQRFCRMSWLKPCS